MRASIVSVSVVLAVAGAASAQVNGQYKPVYGAPISVQNTQTQFGNSSTGLVNFANGSELNAAYCYTSGGNLNFFFSGNLESNFNKFEFFIDSKAGGQNKLRGDNPNVDFNGLNRLGDDGSGNGLTFDTGFTPDYWVSVTGGDVGGGTYGFFASGAELLTGGGGNGQFLGGNDGQSGGALTGGTNFLNILAAINNSNTLGVGGGAGLDGGALTSLGTGIEISIPLASLGLIPGQVFTASAFINGGSHDFLANQVLGGVGGVGNLGEPRNVNFNNVVGNQYFTVPAPGAAALLGLGGLLAGRRRR